MTKACVIYLVRHGESEHNRADIISDHGGAIRTTLMRIQNLTHKEFPAGLSETPATPSLFAKTAVLKLGKSWVYRYN
jgi:broad specificity phosphatase PhoE